MCYTKEVLQQILDNAYEGDLKEALEHIESCPICKKNFRQLKESDDLVLNALQKDIRIPSIHAFDPNQKFEKERRSITMSHNFRRWSAIAATLIIICSVFAIHPVRAAAAEFLKMFRVQDVKAISISEQDINKMNNLFESGKGSVDINNMIKCSVNTSQQKSYVENPTADTIKENFKDAKIIDLPEGFKYSYAQIIPKSDVTLTLDVKKVNEFLSFLGEKAQLPEDLDGQPFIIHTDDVLNYGVTQNNSKYYFDISQMNMPSYEVPSGVDINDLANVVISMDIMPTALKQQLSSIGDYATTLPFPYEKDKEIMKNINVNGQEAILIQEKDNKDNFRMCFKENNYFYVVQGTYPEDKLLTLF